LYLWHWPLLSLAWIIDGRPPARDVRITIVLVSIGLAWITYRLIERPVRFRFRSRSIIIQLLLAMCAIGILSYAASAKRPDWLANASNRVVVKDGDIGAEPFLSYYSHHFFPCEPESDVLLPDDCQQSHKNGQIELAIIGDSHAQHLLAGLAAALPGENVAFVGTVLPVWKDSLPSVTNREYSGVFKYVIDHPDIKVVIISAFWNQRLEHGEIPKDSSLEKELTETVKLLTSKGKRVYLANDVPYFSFEPQRCKYSRELGPPQTCEEDADSFESRYSLYSAGLQGAAATNANVSVLNTAKLFCDKEFCRMERNGVILYRDPGHLNVEGSRFLGKALAAENPDLQAQ